MSVGDRVFRVGFDDPEAFEREYAANLVNGGVFIETDEPAELRERVSVELWLGFCGRHAILEGEIVHRVTAGMAKMGAPVGVAVQFDGSAHTVRNTLEPLRQAAGAAEVRREDAGRRRSPRMEARVAALVGTASGEHKGHTRNLSQTGVLISLPGARAATGDRLDLSLTHPGTGEVMETRGVVVRELDYDGSVSDLAIEFTPDEAQRSDLQRFIESVQAAEHARRLGGITGDIEELGIENLLQMFANGAMSGTLSLRDGEREGVVGFEKGMLRFVRLGSAGGMKALVRLLTWATGTFEFHARLDPVEPAGRAMPLDAALLEATRLLDESTRHPDVSGLPPDAVPRAVAGLSGSDETLTKTEAAILDLVHAGLTVRRIVAVIPEPDPEVQRALASLIDRGVIAL